MPPRSDAALGARTSHARRVAGRQAHQRGHCRNAATRRDRMSPRQRRSRRPSLLSRNLNESRTPRRPVARRRVRARHHRWSTSRTRDRSRPLIFVLAPKVCAACGPGTREILARISERVPDPARQDELKGQAERLNPDTLGHRGGGPARSRAGRVGARRAPHGRGPGPPPAPPSGGPRDGAVRAAGRRAIRRRQPRTRATSRVPEDAMQRMRSRYNQAMHVTDCGRDSARAQAPAGSTTHAGVTTGPLAATGPNGWSRGGAAWAEGARGDHHRLGVRSGHRCPGPAAAGHTGGAPRPAGRQQDIFRSGVDVVTTDVIVRDSAGQFVPDLKKDEFTVLEDGVKQDVVSFILVHGGRTTNLAAPPPPPVAGGHHPAALAADDRRLGPHLPDLRRRPAPRLPQHRPHPRAVQEDCEGPDSRRRHVRHRLDRAVVAVDRPAPTTASGWTRRSRRSPAPG